MKQFTRKLLFPAIALSLAACSDEPKPVVIADITGTDVPPEDSTAPDVADDAAPDVADDTAPDIADDTAPDVAATPCSATNREACFYMPPTTYEVETREVSGLKYTDVSGAERNVNIAFYRPIGVGTKVPVVLMSHGGAGGKNDPMKSMEHWGPVLAKAGYLAVAIAHEGRDEASYAALCAALETNPLHICGIKISWDRPHDVQRVLTYLKDEVPSDSPLQTIMDLEHIAHIGHSAGASAVLMSMGATRNFKCALPYGFVDENQDCKVADLVSLAVDDIDVGIALSPQGPGTEGFMTESYGAVTKPFMMATGANDGDEGEPAVRYSIFPLLPEGDKARLYIDDQGAKHTLFEGDTGACEPIAGLAKCEAMRSAVFATAVAFFDAHLKNDANAKAWLASGDIVKAGQGLLTFDAR